MDRDQALDLAVEIYRYEKAQLIIEGFRCIRGKFSITVRVSSEIMFTVESREDWEDRTREVDIMNEWLKRRNEMERQLSR